MVSARLWSRLGLVAAALVLAAAAPAAPAGKARPPVGEDALMASGRATALKVAARPDYPNPGMAYSCLALASLAQQGDRGAVQGVRSSADALMARLRRDGRGRPIGWPFQGTRHCAGPGTTDAFGDKTCNTADTTYSFQTGLAATCLARATIVTGQRRYAETARQILNRWASVASERPCRGCVLFYYSDSPNDRGRSVRNTNVLMGMAAAWTWRALRTPDMRILAEGVAATEDREARNDNRGYLGLDDDAYRKDPPRQSRRIENHAVLVAKGLVDIGWALGDRRTIGLGREVMIDWHQCRGADCSKIPCPTWSGGERCADAQAVMPCVLPDDPVLGPACRRAIGRSTRFSYLQTWAVADGRLFRRR